MHLNWKIILLLLIPTHVFALQNLDFSVAMKMSQKEKRPLLVFFTDGKMSDGILHAQEFVEKTEDVFVFTKVDFSCLQKNEIDRIRERFSLQDLPRLVLIDDKGSEIGRYGIYGETPASLAKELLLMVSKSKDLSLAMQRLNEVATLPGKLEELYKIALELKKEKEAKVILSKGIEKNDLFFLIEKYRLLAEKGEEREKGVFRKKIISADPSNEKEALFSLALIDFQTLAATSSGKEAVKPLEEYLATHGSKDHKNRWRLEMMIAQFYLNYDDWKTSLHHAEMACKEAPDFMKNDIQKCCHYIEGQLKITAHSD